MPRLAAVVACFALCLVVAACGGSSSSSSTPTSTPTAVQSVTGSPAPSPIPRPAGSICNGADLYGAFVLSQGTAGTMFYQLGVTNTGAVDCILVNPPVLHFRDASGVDLGITVAAGTDCPAGGPYDPATCIDQDAVDLPPGQPTPAAGASGQVTVTIAVADIELFAPCPSPNVQAHLIALRFTGMTSDVRIELPQDIDLLTCADQLSFHGYGPSS
jgi:hypothetical protein